MALAEDHNEGVKTADGPPLTTGEATVGDPGAGRLGSFGGAEGGLVPRLS